VFIKFDWFLGKQKAHHVSDGLRHPYLFPDTTSQGKSHMMGSLSLTGFFTIPLGLGTKGLGYCKFFSLNTFCINLLIISQKRSFAKAFL
jgi:hypothetical protein